MNKKTTPKCFRHIVDKTRPILTNFVHVVPNIFATNQYKYFPLLMNKASTLPCES